MKQELRKKLKGQIIKVTLFCDVDPDNFSVYFAMKQPGFDNFIEIKRFNPSEDTKNNVKTILTLRKKNLLVFEQLRDGSFIIIDNVGEIGVYQFNGSQLERTERLWVHEEDRKDIAKKFGAFERVIINKDVMIARRHIYYLHDSQESLVPGVLMSENLVEGIDSDYNFDCVDGPILYKGQDAFISMYVYKDSKDQEIFYFRQRIYRMPNSSNKRLVNDFNSSCQMSTFLESGDILANFAGRFLKFNNDGVPIDEIIFDGQPTQFHGEQKYKYADQAYLVVYWHQFKCEDDDGICKQIFVLKSNENIGADDGNTDEDA